MQSPRIGIKKIEKNHNQHKDKQESSRRRWEDISTGLIPFQQQIHNYHNFVAIFM